MHAQLDVLAKRLRVRSPLAACSIGQGTTRPSSAQHGATGHGTMQG